MSGIVDIVFSFFCSPGSYDEHCFQGGTQDSSPGYGANYSWSKPGCQTS